MAAAPSRAAGPVRTAPARARAPAARPGSAMIAACSSGICTPGDRVCRFMTRPPGAAARTGRSRPTPRTARAVGGSGGEAFPADRAAGAHRQRPGRVLRRSPRRTIAAARSCMPPGPASRFRGAGHRQDHPRGAGRRARYLSGASSPFARAGARALFARSRSGAARPAPGSPGGSLPRLRLWPGREGRRCSPAGYRVLQDVHGGLALRLPLRAAAGSHPRGCAWRSCSSLTLSSSGRTVPPPGIRPARSPRRPGRSRGPAARTAVICAVVSSCRRYAAQHRAR